MNRAERRALKKSKKNFGNPPPIDLFEGMNWNSITSSMKCKPKESEPEIPGVTVPPEIPEFDAMVKRNKWHDRSELDEVVRTIQSLSHAKPYEEDGNTLKPGCSDWSWARNYKCKYINVRFDMRDGGFVITNDEGERINLEHLKWQYKSQDEKES